MDLKQDFDDTQNNQQEEEQEHFHVLAVDDSLIDRKLLEKLLTVSSYKVTCVDSGDKALEYLGLLENNDSTTTFPSSSSCSCLPSSSQLKEVHGSKVNMIMTDYSMPGMSGYDLLKRVKGSTWKDVPVVVMSSENVPSRINMCLEGGAKEFLLKPVKLSDLRKLQSYLLNSLTHSNCKIIDNEFVDQNHDNTINDHDISSSSSSSSSSNKINDKSSTNNANKRKAMSPDRIERRPKMKELVVLIINIWGVFIFLGQK